MATRRKPKKPDPLNALELGTSINLDFIRTAYPTEKTVHHFIYASTLYGTLFSIYATFEGTKIGDPGKQKYKMNKISMRLVNYKGPVNMGFVEGSPLYGKPKYGLHPITFQVMGTSTKLDTYIEPVNMVLSNKDYVIFFRQLVPMPEFQKYWDLRKPKKKGIDTGFSEIGEEPPISMLFDSEFNDRDGVGFYNRGLKPGMLGVPDKIDNPAIEVVGNRCNTSKVRFTFNE